MRIIHPVLLHWMVMKRPTRLQIQIKQREDLFYFQNDQQIRKQRNELRLYTMTHKRPIDS